MDKRYQIFVSSTYEDLKDVRQEVSTAILRSACFPSGMELFPATDTEQFAYIKGIINECDYYLIIIAGRYGSVQDGTEISYTELEYDYAISIGKPVIALLHRNPFDALPQDRIERTQKGRKALEKFREKLKTGRLVGFWGTPHELGKEVAFAISYAKSNHPAIGWVRGEEFSEDRWSGLRDRINYIDEKGGYRERFVDVDYELSKFSDDLDFEVFLCRKGDPELPIVDGCAGKVVSSYVARLFCYYCGIAAKVGPMHFNVLEQNILYHLYRRVFGPLAKHKMHVNDKFIFRDNANYRIDLKKILFRLVVSDVVVVFNGEDGEYYSLSEKCMYWMDSQIEIDLI